MFRAQPASSAGPTHRSRREGRRTFDDAMRLQASWVNRLSGGVSVEDIEAMRNQNAVGLKLENSPVHPKAMPVILTTPAEVDRWLEADTPDALPLQRPLPDDMLRIVAKGERADNSVAEPALPSV